MVGDDVALTASFGGTSSRADDTDKKIMERAEKALAVSQAAGHNRMTVAE
jgi:GGDEF domain-containing protein